MKIYDIIKEMEELSPIYCAEEWDNIGLLIGNKQSEAKAVLVTLDVTPKVINEAIQKGVNLIISHHPLIFKPLVKITEDDYIGSMVLKLVRSGISLYSAHTNFDSASGGLNDILCNMISLRDLEVLSNELHFNEGGTYGIGRVAHISEEITIEKLINKLKTALNIDNVIYTGDEKRKVSKIAVCTGSGGSLVQDCINKNIDVFITGEIKYHEAQIAVENGVDIIVLGHYESEFIFVKFVAEHLTKYFSQDKVGIYTSQTNKPIFHIR